jgi:DNA ligase (NAD+)
MDIEGLGEKNVELLYSARLINHFLDLYKLEKVDLLGLPGFAEKSAQQLIDSIEESKKTTFLRFIISLGINYVGESAAKLLASEFETIDDLYGVTVKRLKKIEQIGEKAAISVYSFFNDKKNIEALESLKALDLDLLNPDFISAKSELKAKRAKPLLSKGLTFVITGKLPKGRVEVERYIESLGGSNSKSISKKTDYLVVGEDPKSKLKKARELGVKTITYEELMKLSKEEIKGE